MNDSDALVSLLKEFNYYSELMALPDQYGEPLFYCIVLGLVCKACMKSGDACSHRLSMAPVSLQWQMRACRCTSVERMLCLSRTGNLQSEQARSMPSWHATQPFGKGKSKRIGVKRFDTDLFCMR